MAAKIPVGIQLYSIRDVIGNDVPGTLKTLADMGYEGVEFAGYYGLSGEELRGMLDACGLRCAGSHTGMAQLEGDALAQTIATNQALGNERLIIPHATFEDLDGVLTRIQAIYKEVKAAGMRLGFHNHKAEFEIRDGQTIFERIFSSTDDDFLVQLDIGWAAAAGQDVSALLRKYAQRLETVHVKEFNPDVPEAVVGEGLVDWPTVMDVVEQETSVAWYIVEQEKFAMDPLTSARGCIENIRKMGR